MNINITTQCYHCGDECLEGMIEADDKHFCCKGCLTVYQLLNEHEMDDYYCLNEKPGTTVSDIPKDKYAYLDQQEFKRKLIEFSNQKVEQVTLYLPQIHCSSCLWLLEHLQKINEHILQSQVNFATKKITIAYDNKGVSLRSVVELLTRIGYEPHIDFNQRTNTEKKYSSRKAAYKLGITGFCFANIMLISFPEYLGLEAAGNHLLSGFFKWVNLLLSIPVVLYGAWEFFVNAYYSLRQRYLNIDAPIALAILVTFVRSVYEVVSGTGAGYFDSMSGIVFFMLLGRTLQNRTYTTLSFNKDYTSYFPITVTRVKNEEHQVIKIEDIQEGDVICIQHQEVIPTDGMLSKGDGYIDYSYITGESAIDKIPKSGMVYAGGKNAGRTMELVVVKPFSQNSFTSLWNNKAFAKKESDRESVTTVISKYFSIVVMMIAVTTFTYWQFTDPARAWPAATAVLIVACPCALLLTATFTNGYLMDYLSRRGIFLKNAQVIEKISGCDHLSFDKTGTITESGTGRIDILSMDMEREQLDLVLFIMNQSIHPLSMAMVRYFGYEPSSPVYPDLHIKEYPGQGIAAWYQDQHIKIGSRDFVGGDEQFSQGTQVWVSIDNDVKAVFGYSLALRPGVKELFEELTPAYGLSLISGDNESSMKRMGQIFPEESTLIFNSTPEQKLKYIASVQESGKKVMMIGDGLNDAGALRQSDVGVALVHQTFSFTPACDVIMKDADLHYLFGLIRTSKSAQRLILFGFLYSILFNIIGIGYAVAGKLVPMIAAILMPLSSLGIILIAFTGISWTIYKNFRSPGSRMHKD